MSSVEDTVMESERSVVGDREVGEIGFFRLRYTHGIIAMTKGHTDNFYDILQRVSDSGVMVLSEILSDRNYGKLGIRESEERIAELYAGERLRDVEIPKEKGSIECVGYKTNRKVAPYTTSDLCHSFRVPWETFVELGRPLKVERADLYTNKDSE